MKALLKGGIPNSRSCSGRWPQKENTKSQQWLTFSLNKIPSSNDGYEGVFKEERKGFRPAKGWVAEIHPRWVFLLRYGL